MAIIVNYMWLAVVGFCMFVHIDGYCIFGFCNDPTMIAFEPNLASAIFMFTVSCIIADFPLYPKSFRAPHSFLLYTFEILLALLITNIVLMLCWIPMVRIISNVCTFLANAMITIDKCMGVRWLHLSTAAPRLESDGAHDVLATVMAAAFYTAYVYATESFLLYSMYLQRIRNRYRPSKPIPCRGRGHVQLQPDYYDDDPQSSSAELSDPRDYSPPLEPQLTRRYRRATRDSAGGQL